jgi:hypothetical protein
VESAHDAPSEDRHRVHPRGRRPIIGVDAATVTPIPNPTPELVRVLKGKAAKWARSDRSLAKRRARKDDSFREEAADEEAEVDLVREDQLDAFGVFCYEMSAENARLTAERRAEVAELVRKHRRTAR